MNPGPETGLFESLLKVKSAATAKNPEIAPGALDSLEWSGKHLLPALTLWASR